MRFATARSVAATSSGGALRHKKNPPITRRGDNATEIESAEADLGQDALTGEQFGGEADHEAQHGQTAIPGLGERNKTEAGGGVSHGVEVNLHIS